MRHVHLVLLSFLVLGFSSSFAQIPNSGFEQWTSGTPNGWFTNNIPGFATTVTQSSVRHSGSFSAQGTVVTFGSDPYSPLLYSAFPVSQRHATLSFWAELTLLSGDGAAAVVVLYRAGNPVGLGGGETYQPQSWQQINVLLEYVSGEVPDSCVVEFVLSGDSLGNPPHLGSMFRLDDLAFSGIVSVDDKGRQPAVFSLDQNYPNPFNPVTTIQFTLPVRSRIDLTITNLLGQQVATIASGEYGAGSHPVQWNASEVPSGVYFYRLRAEPIGGVAERPFIQSRKLVLLK